MQAWPDPRQSAEFFLGAIFLFCYALPLSFIVCCYFLIGWKVWNRDAPGITTERGVIQKSKIRVVKMLAVVVLLFALSWLPLYVVNLIIYFFNPGDESEEMRVIHDSVIPLAQWLGTSNSCMNPLVYCLFSKRIRERIRLMVTCGSGGGGGGGWGGRGGGGWGGGGGSESRGGGRGRALSMYSSTRHMTVDYSNGRVKLAFRSVNNAPPFSSSASSPRSRLMTTATTTTTALTSAASSTASASSSSCQRHPMLAVSSDHSEARVLNGSGVAVTAT